MLRYSAEYKSHSEPLAAFIHAVCQMPWVTWSKPRAALPLVATNRPQAGAGEFKTMSGTRLTAAR